MPYLLRASKDSIATRARWCLVPVLLLGACAHGVDDHLSSDPSSGAKTGGGLPSTGGESGDSGSAGASEDSGAGGAAGASQDSGAAGASQDSGAAGASQDSGATTCHVVINEVLVAVTSAASHEWVELYNPCAVPVALADWKLVYRSASGSSDVTLFSWPSGSLAPGSYWLIGGSQYSGSIAADGVFKSGGLAGAGGGLELRDQTGTPVDAMGYGTATNAFVEGQASAAPPIVAMPGNSVARVPNGVDTDDNENDFRVQDSPTPRGPNQ